MGAGEWVYPEHAMLQIDSTHQIPPAELTFSYARSSGPGGQAVNKVNSKALLRWNPAGSSALPEGWKARFLALVGGRLTIEGDLLITSDRHRDRLMNQQECLEKLRELILSVKEPPKPRKKTKPTRGSRERAKVNKKRHGEKKRGRSGKNWD